MGQKIQLKNAWILSQSKAIEAIMRDESSAALFTPKRVIAQRSVALSAQKYHFADNKRNKVVLVSSKVEAQ